MNSGASFLQPWDPETGFAPDVYDLVRLSGKIARGSGAKSIGCEHLLAAMLHLPTVGTYFLAQCIMTPSEQVHDRAIRALRREFGVIPIQHARRRQPEQVPLAASAVTAIARASDEARPFGRSIPNSADLALSILKNSPAPLRSQLSGAGVTYFRLEEVAREALIDGVIEPSEVFLTGLRRDDPNRHLPWTDNAQAAMTRGEGLVQDHGDGTLTPEALLAGILQARGVGYNILTQIADPGPDSAERPDRCLRREFGVGAPRSRSGAKATARSPAPRTGNRAAKRTSSPKQTNDAAPLPRSPATVRILRSATAEARKAGHNYIGTEHILLALLKHGPKRLVARLAAVRVTYPRYMREFRSLTGDAADLQIDFNALGA